MLRDMKRRRTKYKVSTKAKSYTEIMREVIDNQVNLSNSILYEKYETSIFFFVPDENPLRMDKIDM